MEESESSSDTISLQLASHEEKLQEITHRLENLLIKADDVQMLKAMFSGFEKSNEFRLVRLQNSIEELQHVKADTSGVKAALSQKADKTEIEQREKGRKTLIAKVGRLDEGLRGLEDRMRTNEEEFKSEIEDVREILRHKLDIEDYRDLQRPIFNRLKSHGYALRSIKAMREPDLPSEVDAAVVTKRTRLGRGSSRSTPAVSKCLSCGTPAAFSGRSKQQPSCQRCSHQRETRSKRNTSASFSEEQGNIPCTIHSWFSADSGRTFNPPDFDHADSYLMKEPDESNKPASRCLTKHVRDGSDISGGSSPAILHSKKRVKFSAAEEPGSGTAEVPVVANSHNTEPPVTGQVDEDSLHVTEIPLAVDPPDVIHSAGSFSGEISSEMQETRKDSSSPLLASRTGRDSRPSSGSEVHQTDHDSDVAREDLSTAVGGNEEINRTVSSGSTTFVPKESEVSESDTPEKDKTISFASSYLSKKGVYDYGPDGKRTFWIMDEKPKEPEAPEEITRVSIQCQKIEQKTYRLKKDPKQMPMFPQWRPCGGRYTLTEPQQHGVKFGKWLAPAKEYESKLVKGIDGKLYRGTVPCEKVPKTPKATDISYVHKDLRDIPEDFLVDVDSPEWEEILDLKNVLSRAGLLKEEIPIPRFCGGLHTKTAPLQRGTEFTRTRLPRTLPRRLTAVKGSDGRIYQGASKRVVIASCLAGPGKPETPPLSVPKAELKKKPQSKGRTSRNKPVKTNVEDLGTSGKGMKRKS